MTKHSTPLRTLTKLENNRLRLVFSTFPHVLKCRSYHSVIHRLGFIICAVEMKCTHRTLCFHNGSSLGCSCQFPMETAYPLVNSIRLTCKCYYSFTIYSYTTQGTFHIKSAHKYLKSERLFE